MSLNDLNNTIDFLQKLKKEEEKKQLEEIKNKIKEELLKEIEDVLMHFDSKVYLEFIDKTKKEICFDYNGFVIMDLLKENLSVDVWDVE
jgi:hypothetical protein